MVWEVGWIQNQPIGMAKTASACDPVRQGKKTRGTPVEPSSGNDRRPRQDRPFNLRLKFTLSFDLGVIDPQLACRLVERVAREVRRDDALDACFETGGHDGGLEGGGGGVEGFDDDVLGGEQGDEGGVRCVGDGSGVNVGREGVSGDRGAGGSCDGEWGIGGSGEGGDDGTADVACCLAGVSGEGAAGKGWDGVVWDIRQARRRE